MQSPTAYNTARCDDASIGLARGQHYQGLLPEPEPKPEPEPAYFLLARSTWHHAAEA